MSCNFEYRSLLRLSMEKNNSLSRRNFLRLAVMGSSSILLMYGCSSQSKSGWRFFTKGEASLMDFIAEQIIPTDEWPGGRDAGVTNFIDKQLIGPYIKYQEIYRKGFAQIQHTCEAEFKKPFQSLSWEDQTAFLVKMESGKMDNNYWEKGSDRQLFGLLRNHSMQGYYGSPRHGGNKDNMSYKMLKLDYPVVIGQNRYNK